MQAIAVYNNGRVSTGSLMHRLKQTFPQHRLLLVSTDDIVNKNILASGQVDALFMPGVQNHHSSYRDDVTVAGWQKIQKYIEDGGAYAGLCAGAYLATERFQYSDPASGVVKRLPSTLTAFEGEAIGPIKQYTNPKKEKHIWADHAVARLAFNEAAGFKGEGAACYSLGPYLELSPGAASNPEYKIIARFADVPGQPVALASRRLGKGIALFSGVVAEISGTDMGSFNAQHTMQAYPQDENRRAGLAFARELATKEPERARTWDAMISELKRAPTFTPSSARPAPRP